MEVSIKDTIDNTLVSVNGFEYIEDKLDLKMETLNKENIAMTEDMCQNAYELAVENTKRDIKDVYYGLNWFQNKETFADAKAMEIIMANIRFK